MRKICIINQKGGVGKTTTTVNIASGLAAAGKKVLVIDLDPQGNISRCFPIEETKKDMYHVLVEGMPWQECVHEIAENLSVITSKESLVKAELIMVGEPGRERILSRKLEGVSGFDYILLDCAPSLGLLNQNALLFCNEAFVPVSCDYLGIEGLKKIMATINTLNEVFDHDIETTKIIPTMYDARLKTCKLNLAKLQNEFYALVSDPIRVNSKLKEAPEHSKPIYEYARSSNGSKDYRKLVDQVMHDEESRDDEGSGLGIHEGGMVVTTIF